MAQPPLWLLGAGPGSPRPQRPSLLPAAEPAALGGLLPGTMLRARRESPPSPAAWGNLWRPQPWFGGGGAKPPSGSPPSFFKAEARGQHWGVGREFTPPHCPGLGVTQPYQPNTEPLPPPRVNCSSIQAIAACQGQVLPLLGAFQHQPSHSWAVLWAAVPLLPWPRSSCIPQAPSLQNPSPVQHLAQAPGPRCCPTQQESAAPLPLQNRIVLSPPPHPFPTLGSSLHPWPREQWDGGQPSPRELAGGRLLR